MIADAQRIRHDCERRIHCPARTEEACIDNAEVIELVRFAVAIQRARLRIVAEAIVPF